MIQPFIPADTILADRCVRQWAEHCFPADSSGRRVRRPALPGEINGEANLRETARVIAAATQPLRTDAVDPYAACGDERASAYPPSAFFPVAALDERLLERWVAQTRLAIQSRKHFVSGVLAAGDVAVLLDYARFHAKIDAWEIALFRPATGVRGVYYPEVTHIARVFDLLDIPIGGLHLYYLNKSIQRTSDNTIDDLCLESNVLRKARKGVGAIDEQVKVLRDIVETNGSIAEGYRCGSRGCRSCGEGAASDRNRYDPQTLHKGGDLGRKLIGSGITDLRDDTILLEKLSRKQHIQIESVRQNALHQDDARIETFLNRIEFPCFYLDFEAFAPSLPPYTALRPYEHTPVVVSVHVVEGANSPPRERSFVAEPGRDQREAMYAELKKILGESGSIVVFSKNFESAMVRQLARTAGDTGEAITSRMIDLLEPFSEFWIYHPEQKGKVSLKRILPVYTEEAGYREEVVQDGMHANLGYIRLSDRATDTPGARAAEGASAVLERYRPEAVTTVPTTDEILRYCAVDTIAMYYLVERLRALLRARTTV